jgi:hypothetical protein
MTTFKFFQKINDYNILVDDVPMFRVYTNKRVTQEIIDQLSEVVINFMYNRNIEENRNQLREELSKHFCEVESIYNEDNIHR